MQVKFTSKDITNGLLTLAVNGMRQGELTLMEELKRITPEDTKEMLNSYKIEDVKKESNSLVATVTNTADHASYVEWGHGRPYDYHKPAGREPRRVIYTGEGNRTFARSVDTKRSQVISLIHKALG